MKKEPDKTGGPSTQGVLSQTYRETAQGRPLDTVCTVCRRMCLYGIPAVYGQ